ncbi:MAG TPA: VWA domain-containing protein [Candidatus Dormibacteraeota bacterium]|nr:VWA domain-containing protein [Candidatus Dormibacteraeota bacterium]
MSTDVAGGLVLGLVERLRRVGVPVSTGEGVDAARALEATGLADRERVRAALRATLVKRRDDLELFDRILDAHLALAREAAPPALDAAEPADTDAAATTLLEDLLEALRHNDAAALEALARLSVDLHGGVEERREASERAYLYRILRRIDLGALLQRALRTRLDEDTGLGRTLALNEAIRRSEDFRRLLAEEIRRRLGASSAERGAVAELLEPAAVDADILGASPEQLATMRRMLRPLVRRLAARVAQRRRRVRHGRLDVRRTVRASLSTGGVPVRPAFRRRHITRPELVVLCDVSGSMAEFAGFALALLHALSAEFTRVRCFAFVDGVDEVTDIVARAQAPLEPRHLLARADVVGRDGHSDYGRVLTRFVERFGDAVTQRTSVIVCGDARTNHRPAGVEVLAEIAHRARRLHWLNPEPSSDWDTTDSAISAYARHCDSVHEVRTLRQLEAAVVAML